MEVSKEQKSLNLQGALAYIPFLFVVASLQRLEDETLMFHAKNGAGLTFFFMIAVFVWAWIHPLTGVILVALVLLLDLFGAFNGLKNKKRSILGVSIWAQNIPLEVWFGKKYAESQPTLESESHSEPQPESQPATESEPNLTNNINNNQL